MKFREMMAQLKVDLKTMTFREKVEHIWTNFKEWILIVGGVFVLLVAYLITLLTNLQPVLNGYLLNVQLSDAGRAYITEDYFASIGGTKKQEVRLQGANYVADPKGQAIETNYATMTQMAGIVSAESMDFLISDEEGMKLAISMEIYMDLRKFLTEDELTQWKDKMIYAKAEGTEDAFPVAIDITETAFAKEHIKGAKKVYIGFVDNTIHPENCRALWDFLLRYESQ